MLNNNIILVILMSLVTIMPRLLPLILHNQKIPPLFEEWMKGVPYAALAALIIPNIFFIDSSDVYVGIIGFAVAVLFSVLRLPVYIIVIISVLTIYGYYYYQNNIFYF